MTPHTEKLVWGMTIVCIALTMVGWRYGTPDTSVSNAPFQMSQPTVMMFDESAIEKAAQQTTGQNPFRLNRSPATVPFGTPDVPPQPPAPPPPSPLAAIALKGIVGGPPWRGILSGVPGRERNVVVSAGDTLAGIRVKQVRHDKIVLATKDSIVTLTLQRAWQ